MKLIATIKVRTSFNNVAVFFFGFSLRCLPKLRQNSQAYCINVSLEHRFLSLKEFGISLKISISRQSVH